MSRSGPLQGLRVLDLTHDLGRFGTKLLAEFGADVCRPAGWGSRGHPMAGAAADFGGHLDWWFDVAKTATSLDLDHDSGCQAYRELAARADLVIESMPVGYLAERDIDHPSLLKVNPSLTQVSLTPFGRTGPQASWRTSDLVSGALSGVLSVTGTPEQPLNSWGGQNYNFGGFSAAICGLAGVRSARLHGGGQLVDLSLHEVMVGSIENLFMQFFYDDHLPLPKVAARQGSLHWLGAYQVVPAQSGDVMVTPTPQAEQLIDWMVASGIGEAEQFVGLPVEELLARMPEVMEAIKAFTLTKPADELFIEAQKRHIAFGEVQDVPQVLENPQFAHRGLFDDVVTGDDTDAVSVRAPWRLVRFGDTPIETPATPSAAAADPLSIARQWGDAGAPARSDADASVGAPLAKPLDGLVVVDLSWVLAGPFSTRLLGDLGADVIKIQTEERATLVNRPDYPYYSVWNRSKRSATLDLKHPDALPVIRQLIEQADVLVENYSSGVLQRLGLGWEDVHGWNDQLVYISMSGCGHDGPWAGIISYAPTIHALCGLTKLTNPPGRGDVGCGFSLNDHAAGFGAALSVLAALEARNQTGKGQYIDMAQLEVGAYLIGPALIDQSTNGVATQPNGNMDGLSDPVPNEVYRCADGEYLAVTAVDDHMWAALASTLDLDDPSLASVDARRLARERIDDLLGGWCESIDAAEAMVALQAAGVAAGVVQDAEALANGDKQLQARDFWTSSDLAEFGPRPHDRFPGLWTRTDLAPYRPAPGYLGEANFDVWTEFASLEFDQVAEAIAEGLFS